MVNSQKKVYKLRSTRWWHSLQTEMIERDAGNHTRWKHKWRWHNRGNVWDRIATDWAGEEDWMRARRRKNTLEDKYQFVTFALDRVWKENKGQDTEGLGTGRYHNPHWR